MTEKANKVHNGVVVEKFSFLVFPIVVLFVSMYINEALTKSKGGKFKFRGENRASPHFHEISIVRKLIFLPH